MDSRPLPTHWPEAGQLGPASQRKVHPNRNLKLQMRESPSRLGNAISQITTLFPPFSFPFLFWMRFKKVHRNQDCFGSKSSRGRGSVVGARKRTKSPLQTFPLSCGHAPLPMALLVSLGSLRPLSSLPSRWQLNTSRGSHLAPPQKQLLVRGRARAPLPPQLRALACPSPCSSPSQDGTTVELEGEVS